MGSTWVHDESNSLRGDSTLPLLNQGLNVLVNVLVCRIFVEEMDDQHEAANREEDRQKKPYDDEAAPNLSRPCGHRARLEPGFFYDGCTLVLEFF